LFSGEATIIFVNIPSGNTNSSSRIKLLETIQESIFWV